VTFAARLTLFCFLLPVTTAFGLDFACLTMTLWVVWSKNFAIVMLHAVSHGLHVDCDVSDDGLRVRIIYVDDLISTASHAADKR